MKKSSFFIALLLLFSSTLIAQVAVNTDGSQADNSAILDVKSNTKGALLPRMTLAEISAIATPANGLQVFCITDSKMYIYVAPIGQWKEIAFASGFITPPFSCGISITDSRDGKSYNTVQIGSQCWMKQNMNIGIRITNTVDPTDNSIIEKYCYDNLESNCNLYGGLYQWNEAMQYSTSMGVQGICPAGWHIPTDEEWCQLETFLDPTVDCQYTGLRGTIGGGKMKSNGTIETGSGLWYSPNTGATNASEFTAVPGGSKNNSGVFNAVGGYGNFWCSSLVGPYACFRYTFYLSGSVGRAWGDKPNGFSVRCLRND